MRIRSNDEKLIIIATLIVLLVFAVLSSFSLYFFWGGLNWGLYGAYYIICLILMAKRSPVFDLKHNSKYAVGFAVVYFFVHFIASILNGTPFNGTFYILWGFFFLLIRDDIKSSIFHSFLKCLTILLTISIIEYLIYVITGRAIILGTVEREEGDKIQQFNHLVFNIVSNQLLPRFQSITEEPGLIGTLCGFLIYLVKFKKGSRFSLIIIWLGGLLSLSLAFYALGAINILMNAIRRIGNVKSLIIYLLLISIIGISVYQFRDVISDMIVVRLTDEDSRQRNEEQLTKALINSFDSGKIWFGHGAQSQYKYGGGSGAIVWIYQFGVVSLFSVFVLYLLVFKNLIKRHFSEKYSTWLFFLVFWLSFYQRHYIIYPSFILCFFTCPILYSRLNILNNSNSCNKR